MTTIYAIFLCWYGVSQPCTYVMPWDLSTSNDPTLASCQGEARDMNDVEFDANAGHYTFRSGHEPPSSGPYPYYVCMSGAVVPQWRPAQ